MRTTPASLLLRFSSALVLGALGGCSSVNHFAVNRVGDALSSSGSSYASDNDPELIRAAAPFSLKLIESLLADTPQHTGLLTAAASGFTQYAYAFVQQDADQIEGHDVAQAFALRQRARGLYVRGRDYGLRALDTRHAGFSTSLRSTPQAAIASLEPADATALYWTTIAWAASISLDKDSAAALAELPRVNLLVARLQELAPDFDHGSLDTFLISYEMGRPGARDPTVAARRSFARAVQLSSGQRAGPYVALAETVCVRQQNRSEFLSTLKQALAVDPDAQPQWRLENHIMQNRARWLLTQTDQLILE